MSYRVEFEQWIPLPLEPVFLFFANPGNLPRIMPPWMQVELLQVHVVAPPGVEAVKSTVSDREPLAGAGSELTASYRVIPLLPFRAISGARITAFVANQYFEDIQTKGPFKAWHHRHEFQAERRNGTHGTIVRDLVEYDVGFGFLGKLAQKLFVGPQMRRTFEYRQRALEKLLGGGANRGAVAL
jgi:ligand-binding SRPBCC domain-containing protein